MFHYSKNTPGSLVYPHPKLLWGKQDTDGHHFCKAVFSWSDDFKLFEMYTFEAGFLEFHVFWLKFCWETYFYTETAPSAPCENHRWQYYIQFSGNFLSFYLYFSTLSHQNYWLKPWIPVGVVEALMIQSFCSRCEGGRVYTYFTLKQYLLNRIWILSFWILSFFVRKDSFIWILSFFVTFLAWLARMELLNHGCFSARFWLTLLLELQIIYYLRFRR